MISGAERRAWISHLKPLHGRQIARQLVACDEDIIEKQKARERKVPPAEKCELACKASKNLPKSLAIAGAHCQLPVCQLAD